MADAMILACSLFMMVAVIVDLINLGGEDSDE